jgi:hypothetical protein
MKIPASIICLFSAALLGCARDLHAGSLHGSVGQPVTLIGIAEPRKGGAALRGDDCCVWIDGSHDWPSGYVDQRVQVIGVLEERPDLPVFIPKPGERRPQGLPVPEGTDLRAASRRLVVRDATWSVLR